MRCSFAGSCARNPPIDAAGAIATEAPPAHPDAILSVKDSTMTLTTGEREGAFRVFVYVSDGHHHAATANIPIFIR
jgi:hypothetical protein